MLSFVAFVCEMGKQWARKVILYAGDNTTVRQWITRRQSGSRAGRILIRVLNLCEMNYHLRVVGAWWRTYHNIDSDFVTRCSEEEFVEYVNTRGWAVVPLGPAIEQAMKDSERFGPCFLSWKEEEDRQVMMQLKEQRVRRFVDRPLPIPWEEMRVWEWASPCRQVLDFQEVSVARRALANGPNARKVMVSTLPVDAKGTLVRRFLADMSQWGPEVVMLEGPCCARWDLVEEGLTKTHYHVHRLEFVSTELGEALARREDVLRWNLDGN